MKIFGFAFSHRNVSCSTLYNLSNIDHRYLLWGEKSIDIYLKLLIDNQPKYILGMGIYTRKDADKIRIETLCSNKFRRTPIPGSKLQTCVINYFLKPEIGSKLAQGIGNSYCNLVSWKIMLAITSKQLNSQYTFLHIPRTMKLALVVPTIQLMLDKTRRD